ncbi:MAG: hypothetical protein K5860_01435 [Bacteroidales bacterium]|nr:hypothetical protein [Bacteroidales bacterium]
MNEALRTLGLAARVCGGRHSREFSGMRRNLNKFIYGCVSAKQINLLCAQLAHKLAKMQRRRRSLVTFPLGILLTFGKENTFSLLSLNRKILSLQTESNKQKTVSEKLQSYLL